MSVKPKHLAILGLSSALVANAELLVYEGFDYPVDLSDPVLGALEGKDGGTGFGGAWEDMTAGSNNGIPFVYGSEGNTNGANIGDMRTLPDWDGVVDNLEQVGGYVGLSPYSSDQFEDRINARRALAQSAGEMAGPDGVLWMSMVVHFVDTRFNFSPGLMFTDGGGFSERVRDITDGSTGIGIGHGSAWGIDLNAITYNAGVFDTRTNVSDLSTTLDQVLILKFEFGAESDTISTWFFTEDQELSEAVFDENALGTSSSFNIDENSLTTLAVGFTRAGNCYDEIRIGDTFGDVTGSVSVATGPLVLGIAVNDPAAGTLDFSWEARDGKVYDLVSSVDLSTAPETWSVWDGRSNLDVGELTAVPGGPEEKRFFAIVEKNAP